MGPIMDQKKGFSGTSFCIINITETPFIDGGLRVAQQLLGCGRYLNVFVDQSSTGSSSCSQKDRCDDLIFRFHNMNLLKRESVDPFPLL